MCITCNNHSHEEYNVDYIANELALNITTEDVPCNHEQNIYIVQDTDDECSCNKHKCEEPKKVSCRSLACQQLNDECSCKRNKNVRKTTMVNMLLNDILRLQDKMEDGCDSMHKSIDDIMENMNIIYNAVKDEETRAKLQEAFLHYGLDKTVTRAWYNPVDKRIHFYHQNPNDCLTGNVNSGYDCDCCNACDCECKCNENCESDIPYTMDSNCNIIPMNRLEVELPFTIDCTDFLRDIFVNNAYLEQGPVDPDGDITHQFLVIEFFRKLEPDLSQDSNQNNVPESIRIDLTEIWKLDNYYDKWQVDDIVLSIYQAINNLNIPPATTVTAYNPTLRWNTESDVAKINGTTIKVKMPAEPSPATPPSNVTILSATLSWGTPVEYGTIDGSKVYLTLPQKPETGQGADGNDYIVSGTINNNGDLVLTRTDGGTVTIDLPKFVTNITKEGNTITFSWSDNSTPTTINVGGQSLWEHIGNDIIRPIDSDRQVHGAGFYDTTVS